MRKALLIGCLMLACGIAYADFEDWDANDDDQISKSEFYSSVRETGRFDAVDGDNDGLVDEDEFENAGLDGEWEEWAGDDEYLDADELYEQTFEAYDEDRDDNWDEDEYEEAGDAEWLRL